MVQIDSIDISIFALGIVLGGILVTFILKAITSLISPNSYPAYRPYYPHFVERHERQSGVGCFGIFLGLVAISLSIYKINSYTKGLKEKEVPLIEGLRVNADPTFPFTDSLFSIRTIKAKQIKSSDININGVAIDGESGLPIKDVLVHFFGQVASVTDSLGNFGFVISDNSLKEKYINLSFLKPGYSPNLIRIGLEDQNQLKIILQRSREIKKQDFN